MQRTRKLIETNRLILFNNVDEEEILTIKISKSDYNHKDLTCNFCNGHSNNYFLVPRTDGMKTYCNLCYHWYRKDIDWKTIYYHNVFNTIIIYVKNNRNQFDNQDLDLINHFFKLKTNKRFTIEQFIKED